MSEGANKYDDQKLPLQLVEPDFIRDIAKVLALGAQKYGENNWRGGLKWGRTYGAALRHMYAWWKGEDKDPESGMSHLVHAATNLMFLAEWEKTHKELDDRPIV